MPSLLLCVKHSNRRCAGRIYGLTPFRFAIPFAAGLRRNRVAGKCRKSARIGTPIKTNEDVFTDKTASVQGGTESSLALTMPNEANACRKFVVPFLQEAGQIRRDWLLGSEAFRQELLAAAVERACDWSLLTHTLTCGVLLNKRNPQTKDH